MSTPTVRILSNLARAGGTLVSRCLGAMNNIVLLSEIHPLGTHIFNPLAQARDWYGLLKPGDMDRGYSFSDAIMLIAERCSGAGKTLVIRDWAHLDYIGVPFVNRPAGRPQLRDALAGRCDMRVCALVRHPADQWLSTLRLQVMTGRLGLDAFLAGYRQHAEQAVESGFIRYEDFTAEPLLHMRTLCEKLRMPCDPGFIDRWQHNRHVTGDISGMSRGSGARIRPLPRRVVDGSLARLLRGNPDYRQSLELLGYSDTTPDS